MRVGLLECDHVAGRFPDVAGGYPEMFAELLGPHVPGLTFDHYDACHGELPAGPEVCDAYLCSGSRFSVYDRLEWIDPLEEFLRRLHERGRPFVGICFGHQLLAQALGGRVDRAPQGWGVGVQEMTIVRSEDWMRPEQSSCRLPYMHQDQVRKLPADGVLLGRSEHCEIAMFRVGASMLGIEGHPEFAPAYNAALIHARAEQIGPERVARALASVEDTTDAGLVGQWIARFLAQ